MLTHLFFLSGTDILGSAQVFIIMQKKFEEKMTLEKIDLTKGLTQDESNKFAAIHMYRTFGKPKTQPETLNFLIERNYAANTEEALSLFDSLLSRPYFAGKNVFGKPLVIGIEFDSRHSNYRVYLRKETNLETAERHLTDAYHSSV